MKKTICPKCKAKMTLKSSGNQDGAIYKVVKTKRVKTKVNRVPVRVEKIARGSKFQMTVCSVQNCQQQCKNEKGLGLLTTVIGDSYADCRFKLGKYTDKKKA